MLVARCYEIPMPLPDDRNILKLGPPQYPGQVEITPAMVESVRQRIKDAGGVLTVWAVLNEDVYETQFGDGVYLHAHGLALNSADAQRLAALDGGDSELVKWHVRSYRLGLENDLPVFTALWRPERRFRGAALRNPARRHGVEAADGNGLSQGWPAAVTALKTKAARLTSESGKVERHIRFLAPLALVSPRIVAALIGGSAPADLTITALAKLLLGRARTPARSPARLMGKSLPCGAFMPAQPSTPG